MAHHLYMQRIRMNYSSGLTPRENLIKEIVETYEKTFPGKIKQAAESAIEIRHSRANVFGSDKEKELRWALRLPGGLWRTLDYLVKEPMIFHEESELLWFVKTFPYFKVPEKF